MKKILFTTLFLFVALIIPAQSYHTNKRTATSTDSLFCEVKVISDNRDKGTANGHEWVDLGLSVKWATCNVGATNPEEYGGYYAWGETESKTDYSWNTYKYCNGSSRTITKYCSNSAYGYNGFTDDKTVLEATDDAATINWGNPWRMPTYNEMKELIDNCTWTWTTLNGVKGYIVKGKNDNSIFLPASGFRTDKLLLCEGLGYYWSSSLLTDKPSNASSIAFDSGNHGLANNYGYFREAGRSVRPVCP